MHFATLIPFFYLTTILFQRPCLGFGLVGLFISFIDFLSLPKILFSGSLLLLYSRLDFNSAFMYDKIATLYSDT